MKKNFEKIIEDIEAITGISYFKMLLTETELRRKALLEEKVKHEIELKSEIMSSKDLSFDAKVALNSIWMKDIKKFERQLSVLGIAIDNMDEQSNSDNLDPDWLIDFFDKVSLITTEHLQLIWGKLLADATTNKNYNSKILLNSLFLMGNEEIITFKNLTRFCISQMGCGNDTQNIRSYPILFFNKNPINYESSGITRRKLVKLQSLGLIELDFKNDYVLPDKNIKLIYNDKLVELNSPKKNKIEIGNVIFTYEGYLLYSFSDKEYNDNLLDYMIYVWKKRGYGICVKTR